MGSTSTLRLRRSAAQRHALAQVEREIRATDPHGRRKYLRDFADAFQTYESVLRPEQLDSMLAPADIVLVGDYHALERAQLYAARLLQQLAGAGRPLVLGVEMVFVRDQHILDEWRCGQVDEAELRQRIRFDTDWGYDWRAYYELLEAGRRYAARIYGLDCTPRNDLRRIVMRDRHAAAKLAEIRERHADAQVVALFGESHLAPNHLPTLLRQRRPHDRILTVLQNVDPLYWLAAGEREPVSAVRVASEVVCVFSATPLEKYESYRQCLDRWRQERSTARDFAPSIYNLIEALSRFLNIDRYASHNRTQPRFLVDLLPEVSYRDADQIEKLLVQKKLSGEEIKQILARVGAGGSCFVPRMNTMFVCSWQLMPGAEQAARFVHHACRASLSRDNDCGKAPEDRFYTRVLEEALAYFGCRVLCPERSALRETDVYTRYAQSRDDIEDLTGFRYRDYLEMQDFLVLHRDYECNHRQYRRMPVLIEQGTACDGERFEYLTRQLGLMLGSDLYDAYLSGSIAKRFLRALFFRKLEAAGAARAAYFAVARRIRRRK